MHVTGDVGAGVGANLLREEVPILMFASKVCTGVVVRTMRSAQACRPIGIVSHARDAGSPEVTAGLGCRATVGASSIGVAASGLVTRVEGPGLAGACGEVVGILDVLRGVVEGLRAAFSTRKWLVVAVDVVNKRGAGQRHGLGKGGYIVVSATRGAVRAKGLMSALCGVGIMGALSGEGFVSALSGVGIVRWLSSKGLVLRIHADGVAGVGESGFAGLRERHVCLKEVGVEWFKRVLVASCE